LLYQVVPGPTLYSGAVSITQTTSASTAPGTPVTGTGTGAATGGTTTTSASKAATTTLVTTTRTTSPTTLSSKITTIRKLASTTPSTDAAGGGGATQTLYGRCGGTGWTGATACASPAACSSSNPWFSQCVPTSA
jgi:Fungal cellulose binding domain.